MPSPAVSVVMTTYNAMPHVEAAIDSLLAQTLPGFEVIIVDDGSTDGTVEAVAARARADGRIRFMRVPRCGRIAALNLGFRAAQAPYVANHDADDVALPDRLAVTKEFLDRNPRAALVGSGIVPLIDDDGNDLGSRTRPTAAKALRRELGRQMAIFHSSVTYRTSAWEEAGGFDERLPLLEDYDLWVRLAAHWDLANLPVPLAKKRRHAGQAFDERHWTRQGYRTRARIMLRYVRGVRPDPLVLLRAGVYLVMSPRLRLAWLRLTGRDRLELAVRRRMRGPDGSGR